MKVRLAISMLVGVLAVPSVASADVKVWDGGGADANWMTRENWVGDVAPVPNVDSLEFPEGAAQKSNNNNFPFVSYFFGIHFSGASGGYVLSGQLLLLGGPVTSSNTSGTNTINFGISLSVNGLGALTAVHAGGTLTVGQINLLWSLPLSGAGNINITGNLNWTGPVTKSGTGVVTMTYDNIYTGATTVTDGTLIVNGSQVGSPITVAGGTLGGTGTVGSVTANTGTVSPGSSPGILNAGSTSMGPGISFKAELNGAVAGTGYDQLNVTGSVNLGGATLNATRSFVPDAGTQFTIVNNDGTDPVVGTFAGLPEGSSLSIGASTRWFTISYVGGTGNDVVLTDGVATQALLNRSFDMDLSGWDLSEAPAVTTQWDSLDADESSVSGSARAQNADPSINYVVLRQCVVVRQPGSTYSFGGRVFIPFGQPETAKAGFGVTWFSGDGCTNSISVTSLVTVVPGAWQSVQQTVAAPAGAKSALSYAVLGWGTTALFDNIFFGPVNPAAPALSDVNGDGNGDAFLYNAVTGAWQRQIAKANGNFATASGHWGPGWTVAPARFDSGALTDFFLFNTTTGQWQKMLNSGPGFTIQASGAWWPGWERYVLDLNGDGFSDLFLYDPATGTWFTCLSSPTGFTYSQGAWSPGWEIYPMRLNNDAYGDLFLISRATGQWFWVLGTAGGAFSYPVSETWFPGWELYPGDFNGDELSDLFLYSQAAGEYYVALNNGAGFTYAAGYGWAPGWTPYVMDLDADGQDDLFLHDEATGVWFQMIGDGVGNFTNVGGHQWALGWNLHPTDFNGDGRADIVLYDPVTGTRYLARNMVTGTFSYTNGPWAPGSTVITRAPIR